MSFRALFLIASLISVGLLPAAARASDVEGASPPPVEVRLPEAESQGPPIAALPDEAPQLAELHRRLRIGRRINHTGATMILGGGAVAAGGVVVGVLGFLGGSDAVGMGGMGALVLGGLTVIAGLPVSVVGVHMTDAVLRDAGLPVSRVPSTLVWVGLVAGTVGWVLGPEVGLGGLGLVAGSSIALVMEGNRLLRDHEAQLGLSPVALRGGAGLSLSLSL